MIKLIFFGTGKNAERMLLCLNENVKVTAFVDNNALKWGDEIHGHKIMPPEFLSSAEYDYIVIATANYAPVAKQLTNMGIDGDRLIIPFSFRHDSYGSWRQLFHIEELIYIEMCMRLERQELWLGNIEYEIAAKLRDGKLRIPIIHNAEETVRTIVEHGMSMSRYGDGEMDIIFGRDVSFQPFHEKLARKLKEILSSNQENHIVCLPNIYGFFDNRTEEFVDFFRAHLANGVREKEYSIFDMNKEYYDSFVTRPYKDYKDKSGVAERFALLKSIWCGRDITIVEGDRTRFGVGNDLLKNASSCIRILGPNENAFGKYDGLIEAVRKTDKDRLVLIALGPTATVMAYDLACMGYQALDIGHVDIEYEWYLRGAIEKIPIEGKYVNEVPEGHNVSEIYGDEDYNEQIVDKIVF